MMVAGHDGGIAMDAAEQTALMPAAFFGHGNPMNALETNRYTGAWQAFGRAVPRPRAILARGRTSNGWPHSVADRPPPKTSRTCSKTMCASALGSLPKVYKGRSEPSSPGARRSS